MQHEHGGDIYRNEVRLDYSVNINPFGMPESVYRAAQDAVRDCVTYPDSRMEELKVAIARMEQVAEEQIHCGNGAAECIFSICQAVRPKRALLLAPTFAEYERALLQVGAEITYIALEREQQFRVTEKISQEICETINQKMGDGNLVFLCNPNNPTGQRIPEELLWRIVEQCEQAGTWLVIDECFLEFCETGECDSMEFYSMKRDSMKKRLEQSRHLIILKAFTKIYGMPGLRLGYCLSGDAELMEALADTVQPWNVSLPAQRAGVAAAKETGFVTKTQELLRQERKYLIENLQKYVADEVYGSSANFIFFHGREGLAWQLRERGILIRDCSNYRGLEAGDYRICIRQHEENRQLVEALGELEPKSSVNQIPKDRKARSIMIQGTMSNAGKSLITAGLCRIFAQDGYRVAPFKSQNMALNSYITKDGLEMGRAQVVQAQACGIEPTVQMNPILLKPTTDMGSQVIVNGKVRGNMRAVDYFKNKRELIPEIRAAYDSLAQEYDVIVIEGAGSPAEINLKKDDIVNMGMAAMADAPVLLVGDIDRGGVFAQLYGTVELLESEERERICGLIINKFRGDESILAPGLAMLEAKCRKPVLGVVPYLHVDLEDEDSLSERFEQHERVAPIDIAVIQFPRISNFTDFNALDTLENVSVRYVSSARQLGEPDLIILPGTKSTMADLRWMRQNGLEAGILKAESAGTLIFGICGGYQMLGQQLTDLVGAEDFGTLRGMGLLPMTTEFCQEKTRVQSRDIIGTLTGAFVPLSGAQVTGYEIHMGRSQVSADYMGNVELFPSGGLVVDKVCGTYLHGIFDSVEVRRQLEQMLCERKGIICGEQNMISYEQYREQQFDELAQSLREHLNLEEIYRVLGFDRA